MKTITKITKLSCDHSKAYEKCHSSLSALDSLFEHIPEFEHTQTSQMGSIEVIISRNFCGENVLVDLTIKDFLNEFMPNIKQDNSRE